MAKSQTVFELNYFYNHLEQREGYDTQFLDKICWTDEACFKTNGHVNWHNSIYRASENPDIKAEKMSMFLDLLLAGVCSSLIDQLFDGNVTGHHYAQALQNDYEHFEQIARYQR